MDKEFVKIENMVDDQIKKNITKFSIFKPLKNYHSHKAKLNQIEKDIYQLIYAMKEWLEVGSWHIGYRLCTLKKKLPGGKELFRYAKNSDGVMYTDFYDYVSDKFEIKKSYANRFIKVYKTLPEELAKQYKGYVLVAIEPTYRKLLTEEKEAEAIRDEERVLQIQEKKKLLFECMNNCTSKHQLSYQLTQKGLRQARKRKPPMTSEEKERFLNEMNKRKAGIVEGAGLTVFDERPSQSDYEKLFDESKTLKYMIIDVENLGLAYGSSIRNSKIKRIENILKEGI